jgi:hypothetical protein
MIRHAKIVVILLMFLCTLSHATGVIVYPASNQSAAQQSQDQGECLSWASGQTGFDPTAPVQTTTPPPPDAQPTTDAGRGALRGALLGVAIGAIGGHAGRGAAIGAGTGALVGGARSRNQRAAAYQQQSAWANDQTIQYQQRQDNFNQAYGVCLQGRGYTVGQ